jgi:hypothetical protein
MKENYVIVIEREKRTFLEQNDMEDMFMTLAFTMNELQYENDYIALSCYKGTIEQVIKIGGSVFIVSVRKYANEHRWE